MYFPAGSRSLAKRQQPDSSLYFSTFGTNLGRNCSARHQRRTRLYSKKFGRGAIVTELTPALIARSLRVTKS